MARLFICLGVVLALLVTPIAGSIAGERATHRIPELSRRQLPEPFCIVNVALTAPDLDRRKAQLLEFMRQSFVSTELWMQDFVALNVDYLKFLSLDLIFYRHCSKLQTSDVDKAIQNCQRREPACFGPESARTKIGGTTPALGEPNVTTGDELELIERYIGRDRLSGCSIKVPLRKTANLTEALLVNGDIRKLSQKYVLPIMTTHFRDDDVYIILSRNCEDTAQVFSLITELLAKEGPESLNALLAPVFSPDMTEYLRSISNETQAFPAP